MSLLDFSQLRIVVIGDAMLDRYVTGAAHRISPEAPVPVVLQSEVTEAPGGAANVASNIVALGACAHLLSFVGPDREAEILSARLNELTVEHDLVAALPCTVLKTRIMAGKHQLVRVDREVANAVIEPTRTEELLTRAFRAMEHASVLVLSDYAKGTLSPDICTRLISMSQQMGIYSVVDPKSADWGRYTGADLITPNLKELGDASGHEVRNDDGSVTGAARKLLTEHGIGAVLVTRSERGMSYISATEAVHSPASAREVFDVTGAGDTVLAMVALLMSTHTEWHLRLRLANVAAGIAVGHVGTARVTSKEVELASQLGTDSKILGINELTAELIRLRVEGKRIVFTNGCFDVLHRGHVSLLERASALGDLLVVALNSDESVRRLKGHTRPINTLDDRAYLIAHLGVVDYVTFFDEDTPAQIIELIRPDVLVKGGDYSPEAVVGREHADQTVILPLVPGLSTTAIIQKRDSI
jgi:D-beta-D-heptose 7-phosphate kinase/D-beta-D-heptose 1-phosphate adenosyltransferase